MTYSAAKPKAAKPKAAKPEAAKPKAAKPRAGAAANASRSKKGASRAPTAPPPAGANVLDATLMKTGRERGYLTYDEVCDALNSQELDLTKAVPRATREGRPW